MVGVGRCLLYTEEFKSSIHFTLPILAQVQISSRIHALNSPGLSAASCLRERVESLAVTEWFDSGGYVLVLLSGTSATCLIAHYYLYSYFDNEDSRVFCFFFPSNAVSCIILNDK